MTHPFHPLSGRELDYLERGCGWGENRVLCMDENGHLVRLLPAWTSLEPPDAWELVAAGRSPFRLEDLIEMARLVVALQRAAKL